MLLDCAADLVEEELVGVRWQRNASLAALVGVIVLSLLYCTKASRNTLE